MNYVSTVLTLYAFSNCQLKYEQYGYGFYNLKLPIKIINLRMGDCD
jgi:hypothetical protein